MHIHLKRFYRKPCYEREANVPGGVLEEYMTGGPTYFLGSKFTPSVFSWVKRSVTYFFRS